MNTLRDLYLPQIVQHGVLEIMPDAESASVTLARGCLWPGLNVMPRNWAVLENPKYVAREIGLSIEAQRAAGRNLEQLVMRCMKSRAALLHVLTWGPWFGTQSELGDAIGRSREHTNDLLRALETEGLVNNRYRRIELTSAVPA